MGAEYFDLEVFWEDMLSGAPERTRKAFARLDTKERQAVIHHLERMTQEDGWHPAQRQSAQAALEALANEG